MRDRIQPTLLDRLTDDSPRERDGVEPDPGFSRSRLREVILRDLSWLLNAGQLGSAIDLAAYPHVASSTLNYGVPALTGREASGIDPQALRRQILLTLRRFEPRLLPDTIAVTPIENGEGGTLHFTIEADLWAEPQMLHMLMRTEGGDTPGTVRVVEIGGQNR